MADDPFHAAPAAAGPGSRLAQALMAAVDPSVVLRRIVDQAMVLVPRAEGAAVEIANQDQLIYVCTAGSLSPYMGVRLQLDSSLSGWAVKSAAVMICADSATDGRVDLDACRALGVTSMVCVPLWRASGPVGVLKVTSSQPFAFAPSDVETLTRLSQFVTNAVAAATDTARSVAEILAGPGGERGACSEEAAVAEFIANVTSPGLAADTAARAGVETVLAERSFDMVVQPIFDLRSATMVAVEALCRFRPLPYRPPDVWFAQAQRAGLGAEMELAALEDALAVIGDLPEGIRLALNASPQTITSPRLIEAVQAAGPARVTIELTEHLRVEDYPGLNRRLDPLRRQGAWLAVDDTGAGISSLTHILKLAPDVIKLDRYLCSGVDIDPVRRALAGALVGFAGGSGARVVAEGIETVDELATLCSLGVHYGQGYLLGRPGPVSDLRDVSPAAGLIAEARPARSC